VIRVIRGPEPGVLASARTKGIEQAVAAYNEAGAPSEKLSSALKGYDGMGVKLALFLGQRKKCAY
jgi:hypothetical protein